MTDPAAVLSYYFPQPALVRRIEPLGNAGGWSGSQLWRVEIALRGVPGGPNSPDFCLRRWPREHPSREQLEFTHLTLHRAASAGLSYIPAPLRTASGQSHVEHGGHLWELTPWMPGVADYRAHPARARLRAAFQALARFHSATGDAATNGRAPAFAERLARVAELQNEQLASLTAAVRCGQGADLDQRAGRLIELAPPWLNALEMPLQIAAREPLPLQPAIRDLHHDHVLFTGDEVTGLIDFGALRIDTPLTDVARLLGSLASDDQS